MGAFAQIDLSALPQPAAVQTWAFAAIVQARLSDFTQRMAAAGIAYDTGALESEPAVQIPGDGRLSRGPRLPAHQRSGAGDLLAWAQGADVDVVAANYGTIRAAGELDASLKARAQLAWEALSQGGTYGGYRYKALSAAPSTSSTSRSTATATRPAFSPARC